MRQGMAYDPAETYVGWFAGTPAWAIGENFNGGYPYLHALPRFTVAAAITGSGSIQWIGEYPHGVTAELRLVPATDFGIKSLKLRHYRSSFSSLHHRAADGQLRSPANSSKGFPWILFTQKPADEK